MTVLILGGTATANRLAAALHAEGIPVVTSLAGRTDSPRTPPGQVRTGGFGGVGGMANWLASRRVATVVDATHPFAAMITATAALACAKTQTPLVRLTHPSWADQRADATNWYWVDSHAAAARQAAALGGRILLTTGRQHAHDYHLLAKRQVVVRVAQAGDLSLPTSWRLLVAKGPFDLAGEYKLLREQRISVVISKDSGMPSTQAKLDAAAKLGIAVVMLRRPPVPEGVPVLYDVEAARAWVHAHSD